MKAKKQMLVVFRQDNVWLPDPQYNQALTSVCSWYQKHFTSNACLFFQTLPPPRLHKIPQHCTEECVVKHWRETKSCFINESERELAVLHHRKRSCAVFLLSDEVLCDRLGRKDKMSLWLEASEANLRRLFVRNAFTPDGKTNKRVFFFPKRKCQRDGQKHFEEESRHIYALLLICLPLPRPPPVTPDQA